MTEATGGTRAESAAAVIGMIIGATSGGACDLVAAATGVRRIGGKPSYY